LCEQIWRRAYDIPPPPIEVTSEYWSGNDPKYKVCDVNKVLVIIIIITIETVGPLNASALNFLSEMGRRMTSLSGDSRETSFLFQRLSMLIGPTAFQLCSDYGLLFL